MTTEVTVISGSAPVSVQYVSTATGNVVRTDEVGADDRRILVVWLDEDVRLIASSDAEAIVNTTQELWEVDVTGDGYDARVPSNEMVLVSLPAGSARLFHEVR